MHGRGDMAIGVECSLYILMPQPQEPEAAQCEAMKEKGRGLARLQHSGCYGVLVRHHTNVWCKVVVTMGQGYVGVWWRGRAWRTTTTLYH